MTKFFAKISSWLSAFAVLLCTAALAGDLKVTYEIVQPCVPGVAGYSQAIVDLYVTTGADIGMVTFTSTLEPVSGVTFNTNNVEWDSDVIDTTNAPTANILSSGKLQLKINAPAPLTAAVQPSADPQHICRISAAVDSSLTGETIALPFDITAATGIQGTKSVTKNAWLSDDSIKSVDFNVYQSFNFFVAQGATFVTDEDVALTISAADPEKFEATAWDTATSSLVATTDVAFTGTPTLDPAEAGTIAVQSGALVFTPAENWSGAVVVSTTAKSTTIADTDTDVNFPITVNPVDDPLVVEWESQELVGVEGDAVSGTFTLTATDVDGDKFLTGATVTLDDDFLTVEGTLEQQGSQGGVTTYLFTATGPVVPYTAVAHPSTSWDCPLTVVATDGTTEYELTGTVKIQDTDRPPAITSFEVNGASTFPLEIKADTVVRVNLLTGEDPDEEDTVEFEFYWVDRTTIPWSYTLCTKDVASFENILTQYIPWCKDTENCFAVRANSSYGGGFNETTIDFSFKCVNSAPVVPTDNGSVFVLRHEDKSTPEPGVATFTATDVDEEDDLFLCAEPTRAATPAADTEIDLEGTYGDAHVAIANGTITFTYTVKPATVEANEDTEETLTFYVTDTDEEDFIPVTVKCTFQANPPPVLTADTTKVTVAEVDAEGNPTAFELTVNATDVNVYPAGVGSWAITVPEGWTAEAGEQTTGSVDAGTWEGSATWTITTAGYDTITGNPRDASAEFGVTVSAFDVTTQAEATLDFTVTVNDVDRLPSAPASVALEPTEPVHGDAIIATPSGATDEDGDEIISYTYAWAYSADGTSFTDLAETTDTLNDAEAIKKGYTVKVTAFAVSEPYTGTEATSAEGTEATVVVGNTAPFMSTLGDQEAADATVNLEYTWTVAENSEDNTMTAAATDVDADDGVDSVTYAVSEIAEDIGTLAIDEATGEITFTPATDYNTVETGDTVTFTVTATDESGAAAANTAIVTLVITEVNSAPSLTIEDQYVLPSDIERGDPLTVTATAEMGDSEDAQEISEAVITIIEDENDIFEGEPSVAYAGPDVTVTYTIKADAMLGATAKLKVTIKDNGTTAGNPDPLEAEAEFTIFLGASPWYPILSFECADPENHTEGHTVVIDGSDNSTYSITLKGATYEVLPADYVAIGHPGYAPNTELTITVYPWTQKEGTSTEECAATTSPVADYDTPSEATTDGETELVADDNGFVELPKFSVPMAKSYKVVVKKDGEEIQTIEDDFAPNDEGMVLPDVEGLTIQLTDAGEYTIEVSGTNPAGESEAVALFTVTSEGGEEIDLADEVWDGEFLPGNGEALTNANVRFSWPAMVGATGYTLSIFDGDGKAYDTVTKISGTSQVVELAMDGDVTNYSWFVTATNSKSSLDSDEFAFVLSEASGDTLVITKVVADDNGLLLYYAGAAPEGDIAFSFQYFDVAGLAWTNGNATGEAADGALALPLAAETAAGDFVVLKQGDGEWKIYEVQAQ